jgi:hypothetical protein
MLGCLFSSCDHTWCIKCMRKDFWSCTCLLYKTVNVLYYVQTESVHNVNRNRQEQWSGETIVLKWPYGYANKNKGPLIFLYFIWRTPSHFLSNMRCLDFVDDKWCLINGNAVEPSANEWDDPAKLLWSDFQMCHSQESITRINSHWKLFL